MRSEIEEALLELKRGGGDAMERALALLQESVFSFSMRVCGQRQDAEDTMQEVLVKSLPYLPRFESPKALAVWLYKVAKNRCLMSRRRSRFAPKEELSLDELMPDREELEQLNQAPGLSPEGEAIRGEEGRRLREAIRRLPPPYRIVLVLRDMEGLTDEEVAEITGLKPGTIRVRLHRARLFVRKELAKLNEPAKGALRGRQAVVQAGKNTHPTGDESRSDRCKRIFAGLSDYLDGQLDHFSCEEIEAHLNGCEPCKKFLRSLEETIKRCEESPADCPDEETAAWLRKQLLATYSRALAAGGK